MDESGDLGFDFSKKRTSKNFNITFLFCESPKKLEKIVKKTFLSIPLNKRKSHCGVLHASHEHPNTKYKMLSLLSESNELVKIMTIRLNKEKVYTHLQEEKNVLYNYVVNILLDRIIDKKLCPTNERIIFIAAKKDTNKFLNDQFKNYIQNKTSKSLDLELQIKTTAEHKCLQMVDFLSWSLFQKYEKGNDGYYNLFKKYIVEESVLYK